MAKTWRKGGTDASSANWNLSEYIFCDLSKILNIEVLAKLGIVFVSSYKFQFESTFFIKTWCLEFVGTTIYVPKAAIFIVFQNSLYQFSPNPFSPVCFRYNQFINIDFSEKGCSANCSDNNIINPCYKTKRCIVTCNSVFCFILLLFSLNKGL